MKAIVTSIERYQRGNCFLWKDKVKNKTMTSYKNQPIVKQELEIANRKCKTILNINVYFFIETWMTSTQPGGRKGKVGGKR